MTKFWVGVASKEHVALGEKGGFCQLCHGKAAPLKRMKKGDWIIYYSSKKNQNDIEKYQKFTAIGEIIDDETYLFPMSETFVPYRRNVRFVKKIKNVPLTEINNHPLWIENRGKLRFGHFEIPRELFKILYVKMTH